MSKIQPREMTTVNLANYSRYRNNKVDGHFGSINLNTVDSRRMSLIQNTSIMARNTQSTYSLGRAMYHENFSLQYGNNSFSTGQVVGQAIGLALGLRNIFASNNTAQTPQGAKAMDSALGTERLASLSTT
ncbi:hypothetical protein IJ596_01875, partial [bacterium]|nr:hypothetical protein [bacterium]